MKGMVRFSLPALALACGVMLACSCDSFRKLAGRPTSQEIEAKRELIEREQAAHQARVDSLRQVEKALADSLLLVDRFKESGEMILSTASLRRVDASALGHRYYIIVGAFSSTDNASYMASKIEAAGYESVKIPYGNGFTAVGVCGTDTLAHLWDNLQRVRAEAFCPKDVWILVNE